MLFSSHAFIFVFLPAILIAVRSASKPSRLKWRILLLIGVSLFLYALWNITFLPILLGSISLNYIGAQLLRRPVRRRRGLFIALVGVNVGALVWFKYLHQIENGLGLIGYPRSLPDIGLPLAISFYTFQQIWFLIDCYRRPDSVRGGFFDYLLLVVFFPHLLVGPIVRYADLVPQFYTGARLAVWRSNLAVGLSIFSIGLAKKVLLADSIAGLVDPAFAAASNGQIPATGTAWVAAFAYMILLYFDFSGYSDMAIGLGRMFGVRLPLNFNSPYQANGLVELWQHWHMSITRFFTDQVYSPISLNQFRACVAGRYGKAITFLRSVILPTVFTFVLIGLWHGSGLTFVIFGLLHGFALSLIRLGRELRFPSLPNWLSGPVSVWFFGVTLVFIRAPDIATAGAMLRAMFGNAGTFTSAFPPLTIALLALGAGICFLAPNTAELFADYRPALDRIDGRPKNRRLRWMPSTAWALASAILLAAAVLNLYSLRPFIYLQF
jgi:alginate O-acetyltransferase complex protein AlgI